MKFIKITVPAILCLLLAVLTAPALVFSAQLVKPASPTLQAALPSITQQLTTTGFIKPLALQPLFEAGPVSEQALIKPAIRAGVERSRLGLPESLDGPEAIRPVEPAANGLIGAAAVCTVNTPANSGPGSLRQCLLNARSGDTITFDPQVFPLAAPTSIALATRLPSIITSNLTIDASNAGVILDGIGSPTVDTGLSIVGAAGVKIRGLQIIGFFRDGLALTGGANKAVIENNIISDNASYGIWIDGAGTNNNQIRGNTIGLYPFFGLWLPLGNDAGIVISSGAQNNLVGGETGSARNLISSNTAGVQIEGAGSSGNRILGNYIGTDAAGQAALGNNWGVLIMAEATNNEIGGTTPGARNLISGNEHAGVQVQDPGTSGNRIMGNYIGPNAAGTTAVKQDIGVSIGFGAQNNLVGGVTAGARNIISGNDGFGVWIHDQENSGTANNQVQGNYIGLNATGTAALGNIEAGVVISDGVKSNLIGGDTSGAGNVISGNPGGGVWIQGQQTNGNRVQGNIIGANPAGLTALAGQKDGVGIVLGPANNLIGGSTAGARNLISGNVEVGVKIVGNQAAPTTGNQVQGNYIGVTLNGAASLSNTRGIVIFGGQNNLIGGTTAGAGNLISGNSQLAGAGIQLQGADTTGNQVQGNTIGLDVSGAAPLANSIGVAIANRAKNNLIGGLTSAARNFISGNYKSGIIIQDPGTDDNQILGNYIGVDRTGTRAVSNGEAGVFITTGAKKNLIGSGAAGGGNLISGNTYVGIQIDSSGTIDNRVQGNTIGVNATGTTAVGNGEAGIMILKEAQQNIVGGDTPGTGNLISGNQVGVALVATATANLVQGNKIGSNLTGLARLGNMTGILLTNGATNNLIGGETAGARNLISGNNGVGIQLQSSGTSGNMIRGNYIGTNLMGTAALSNTSGVVIGFKAANNVVTGNLISGNSTQGILISDANFNQVRGNSIGLNAAGQSPLGNGSYGVYLSNGAQSNIIGISNTIVYNGAAGVALSGSTTLRNTITRNIIHSNTSLPIDYLDQPEPISPIEIFYTPQPFVISGTVCAGCTLEVFVNPDETLAGTLYLGQTTAANNGAYSFTWSNPPYPYPALTVTDKKGTTSEFYSDKVSPPRSPAAAVYLPLIVK